MHVHAKAELQNMRSKSDKRKEKNEISTIIIRDFNILLSLIDQKSRPEISEI